MAVPAAAGLSVTQPSPAEVDALVALLPEGAFMRTYIDYASKGTDAPTLFHVGTGLSALSSILPADSQINTGGVPLRLNIFTMLLGSSGASRKSVAIQHAVTTLTHAANKTAIRSVVGPKFGSYAGLVATLAEMPQCVIFDSEFSAMLADAQRGRHLESAKRGLLDVYDCVSQTKALSRESVVVMDPRLTLCVGLAPTLFEYHIEPEDLTGGLLSRFLILSAERHRWRPSGTAYDTAALDRLSDILKQRSSYLPPMEFVLEGESARQFNAWEAAVEAWLTDNAVDDASTSVCSRLAGHALKIAGILSADAYAQGCTTPPLSGALVRVPFEATALRAGIALATMHAKSAMSIVAGLASTPDMRDRRAVLRALVTRSRQRGYATVGELTRDSKLLVPRVRLVLQTLCMENLAMSVDMPGVVPDGKQQPTYYCAVEVMNGRPPPPAQTAPTPSAPQATPPAAVHRSTAWMDEEGYVRED